LYPALNIIRFINSRRILKTHRACSTHGTDETCVYKISVCIPEGKRLLERLRHG